MTIEEFQKTKFYGGMQVEVLAGVHKGDVLDVWGADYDQSLIWVDPYGECYEDQFVWLRCENCRLIEKEWQREE